MALNDQQTIVGGFDLGSTPAKYLFFNHNFNSSSNVWVVDSATSEDVYNSNSTRIIIPSLNDDSTKLINIMQVGQAPIVIVLNPTDGTLIDAKKIELNITFSEGLLQASGQVSNNTIMVSFAEYASSTCSIVFINTETWELNSYLSWVVLAPSGFTPLFNTKQLEILIQDYGIGFFTFQADYDRLDTTELFKTMTYTLSDLNSSLGFNTTSLSFTQSTHASSSLNPTISDPPFGLDSNRTYEVTANLFSANVATLEGDTNSTSLGPIEFDCYSVTTSAGRSNFSDQLSMTQNDGQAIPSWMTFDSSSATVSLSSPEASSANYTVTNSLVGVYRNFTFDTNVIISISEESPQTNGDDDHCLGASSEGLCGFFVTLIIFGVLAPVIFIAILIYVKFRAPTGTNDMTKLDQEQPDEGNGGNENDDNAEGDESVGMNRNNQAQPNMDNGTVQHAEQEFEENQV